eukprot:3536714-Rhodomonas_salina.1
MGVRGYQKQYGHMLSRVSLLASTGRVPRYQVLAPRYLGTELNQAPYYESGAHLCSRASSSALRKRAGDWAGVAVVNTLHLVPSGYAPDKGRSVTALVAIRPTRVVQSQR